MCTCIFQILGQFFGSRLENATNDPNIEYSDDLTERMNDSDASTLIRSFVRRQAPARGRTGLRPQGLVLDAGL